jgi:oxygen-independent coproporphyrinogen-3 oxidase
METAELIDKYNVPVPRYTSYPTVPYWQENLSDFSDWSCQISKAIHTGKLDDGICLYVHLPFCEQLCTYCGCNKRITKNHGVESVYIDAVLKEWEMYQSILGKKLYIRELHLGGGTPTFFSPENLTILIQGLLKDMKIPDNREFSFEGHPNNTTGRHLQALYDLGFRRVSFGVQDLDLRVQKAINRIQPFEKLRQVTECARSTGYESINFDLIYGLPFQTPASVENTLNRVLSLRPDRIAYYSYAHVPWIKKSQRAYGEEDLPKGKEKYALYRLGRKAFANAGYADIGMDHFALGQDSLLKSREDGSLHRNFMGYTTTSANVLIGLGVSAISDVYYGYRQNIKTLEEYYAALNARSLPIARGLNMEEEDILYREQILNIACKGKTSWKDILSLNASEAAKLRELESDGLVVCDDSSLEVTPQGWNFIRNICAVFDKRMNAELAARREAKPLFSSAI